MTWWHIAIAAVAVAAVCLRVRYRRHRRFKLTIVMEYSDKGDTNANEPPDVGGSS